MPMGTEKFKQKRTIFLATDWVLALTPWLMFVIAGVGLFFANNATVRDFSLSYVSGMVVYVLTVVIPDVMRSIKLKRYVIKDLSTLHKDYKDLLRTISDQPTNEYPYPFIQIRRGLERFNCRKESSGICLSNRMIDIIKPKCEKILHDTSLLMSKDKALSVNEFLVIHEITQVRFLRDIASLKEGSDYYQSRKEMMVKADYLAQRFNELHSLYFKIKHQVDFTVGWHPIRRKKNKK